MHSSKLEDIILLKNLKLLDIKRSKKQLTLMTTTYAWPCACTKCASKSTAVYDHRKVLLRDQPIYNLEVILEVYKKRYLCPQCKKPFTEPLEGVLPKKRTTQRFRALIRNLCEQNSNIKSVCEKLKISKDLAFKAFYEGLKISVGKRQNNPWPTSIGIDEHAFKKGKTGESTQFVSMITDHNRKRVAELVHGKTTQDLMEQLAHIPGRERVRNVTLDMSDSFKKFAHSYFPHAQLIADKFHVLRLITPALNQTRKQLTGDKRSLKVRKDVLTNRKKLSQERKRQLDAWLDKDNSLYELYWWKERLHGFYRIHGFKRAKRALKKMCDEMAHSKLKAIHTLRKTLLKWKVEILNYFKTKLTNGRTEGFNNVAKSIKKRSYGVRSFQNYRLRVLNACF